MNNLSCPSCRLTTRCERILDRLDDRMERQTFEPGAPLAVHLADRYQAAAGSYERRLLNRTDDASTAALACAFRALRRILAEHRTACCIAMSWQPAARSARRNG